MRAHVNGEVRELPDGASVADVVRLFAVSADARGVAVALDGAVVRRGSWEATHVAEGARVEVLSAIGGG